MLVIQLRILTMQKQVSNIDVTQLPQDVYMVRVIFDNKNELGKSLLKTKNSFRFVKSLSAYAGMHFFLPKPPPFFFFFLKSYVHSIGTGFHRKSTYSITLLRVALATTQVVGVAVVRAYHSAIVGADALAKLVACMWANVIDSKVSILKPG